MKTRTHSLITPLCAAIASLVVIGSPARAGYIVTLTQSGPNVVANGSGAIDLTGLSFFFQASGNAFIAPSFDIIATGPTAFTDLDVYSGLSGPSNFGTGAQTNASSGSGDLVGIAGDVPLTLLVPLGYVSGTALSDTSTYNNATFSSLGVTPGTYEWTWGAGANQNFTLIIGSATVPDSGSTFMLLSGVIVALGSFRRRCI
jgi:VPDSG-CTERM motif